MYTIILFTGELNPNYSRANATTKRVQNVMLKAKPVYSVQLTTFKVHHHTTPLTLSQRSSNDMGSVPAPANAAEIVPNATKVEEGVHIVHPGPGFGPLVPYRMRKLVLLPSQPRQRIIPAPPPPPSTTLISTPSPSIDVSVTQPYLHPHIQVNM